MYYPHADTTDIRPRKVVCDARIVVSMDYGSGRPKRYRVLRIQYREVIICKTYNYFPSGFTMQDANIVFYFKKEK